MKHLHEERVHQATGLRSDTDASLTAERSAGDETGQRSALIAQRVLDDLLERDRLLADERLFQSRLRADQLLALERLASPTRNRLVARERQAADEGRLAERQLSDRAIEKQRGEEDHRAGSTQATSAKGEAKQSVLRSETDSKLGAERTLADAAEAELQKTSSKLAGLTDAQERRREVLAMVSHDLRSPLTVISLSANLLLDGASASETREVVEDIVRSTARMERLVTDLVDIARIEAGTLRVSKARHDVGALLREVFRLYQPLFAARELTLTMDSPGPLPTGHFDYDRVVQVLSNLLGNALKFTPAGGSAQLGARQQAGEIEFEIRNSAPDIPADALPHLFEAFWQLEPRARRGLGLGLYISKQIVELHGGHILAESSPGQGVSFRFTLPLLPEAHAGSQPTPAATAPPTKS